MCGKLKKALYSVGKSPFCFPHLSVERQTLEKANFSTDFSPTDKHLTNIVFSTFQHRNVNNLLSEIVRFGFLSALTLDLLHKGVDLALVVVDGLDVDVNLVEGGDNGCVVTREYLTYLL